MFNKFRVKHSVKDLFDKEKQVENPTPETPEVKAEELSDKELFSRVEINNAEAEKISVNKYSYWRSVFKAVSRKPSTIISIVLIIIVLFLTIFGPMIYHYDAFAAPVQSEAWMSPSAKHLFGTNQLGRDIWTLVWEGARTSFRFAIVVALINTVIGIVVGSIWGYFRKLDPLMLEVRNFINNIPSMLVYMLLLFVLERSFWTLVFVMCLFGWMGLASFIRNQIIIIQNREYNIASNTLGTKPNKMITHNLLPYLTSVIVTVVSTAIPAAISDEVGLSYFGLGFSNSTVTLGKVLNDLAASGKWMEKPWVILYPALVIISITVAFFTLGIDLADATDPRNHR